MRSHRLRLLSAAGLAAAMALPGCGHAQKERPRPPAPPVASPTPAPAPAPSPAAELQVKQAAEEVIVAAWAEPARLPPGGGQAQILVRAQKRGGAPYSGVEVRLKTSSGKLFSAGKVLVTDATGRTRDRLSARSGARITLNAGGTLYRFEVPVAQAGE